jgi:hypothetical protein
MWELLRRPDLVAIVWVFVNHADKDSLTFDEEGLSVEAFRGIFSDLPENTTPKDLFIVLDCCCSNQFSQQLMERPFTSMPIRFLTGVCWTSLIVVSENTELVNCRRDPIDGKKRLHYSIHSPMLMRELLQMIAYTMKNPKMSEIVAHLHERIPNGRGFEAETRGTAATEEWTLRRFFGPPLRLGRRNCHRLHQIIPPTPLGGFFDDFDKAQAFTKDDDDFRCVEIAIEGTDRFRIVGYAALENLRERFGAVLDDVIQARGRGADSLSGCPHVPLLLIWNAIRGQLPDPPRGAPTSADITVYNDIVTFMKSVNGLVRGDMGVARRFVPYWKMFTPEDWKMMVQDAQIQTYNLSSPGTPKGN